MVSQAGAGVRFRRPGGSRRPAAAAGGRRRQLVERDQLLEAGRGVDEQRDVERDAGERLGRVGEQAEVAGAEALDRHRARDAEDQGVVAQIERVDPLEPGVPGRFGQLGADGRSHLCPQVIGGRCPHGGGSPGLSTGVSTSVQKHRTGRCLGRDPIGPTVWGSAEHRGRPGAPGSRTISALWTTQQATSRAAVSNGRSDCRSVGRRRARGWIVDAAVRCARTTRARLFVVTLPF